MLRKPFTKLRFSKKRLSLKKKIAMKILIDVEENQIDFMLDLLSKFDFVTFETPEQVLAEEEQNFIDDRLTHHLANKDKSVRWEDLKMQLT
jgi:hypothetical protein